MAKAHTHNELSEIARRWLLRANSAKGPGCNIALKEVGALFDTEIADAWGYRWGWQGGSVLVEVKVSRSDFLRDKHKPHRQPGVPALGDWRYYMCPEGLLSLDDMPEGWGLLWVNSRGHVKVMSGHVDVYIKENYGEGRLKANDWKHPVDSVKEMGLLAYLLNRVGDPDALLQQNRECRRAEARLQTKVHELEAAEKKVNRYVSRLERKLDKAGIDYQSPEKDMLGTILRRTLA